MHLPNLWPKFGDLSKTAGKMAIASHGIPLSRLLWELYSNRLHWIFKFSDFISISNIIKVSIPPPPHPARLLRLNNFYSSF